MLQGGPNQKEAATHLKRRYGLVIWAVVVVALAVAGIPYYRVEIRRAHQKKSEMLQAVAELKIREIRSWRERRLADANWSSRSPLLRRAVLDLTSGKDLASTRRLLTERLAMERQVRGYVNVLLLSPDQKVIVAARDTETEIAPETSGLIDAAVRQRSALLGSLFRDSYGHTHLDAVAPIFADEGSLQAVAVMRVDASDDLFPVIQSWPVPSESAETLLVARDGTDVLFLNDLRHKKDTAGIFRIPLTRQDLPATQAILGRQGLWEGKDYRGEPVLAYLAAIPESPWFMVSKVDAREIFAEAHYREVVILGALGLLATLIGVSISLLLHWRRAQVFRDLYRSERQQREIQEEFRATLYSIGDAVITTDRQGAIKQMNGVAERLTGWPEAEAKGRPIDEVFRIVNELTRLTADNPVIRVLRDGIVVGLANHTLLIARDGKEYPIADSAAPIHDGPGNLRGVVLVFRDQSEEHAHQQQLEHILRVLRAVRRINQLIVRERDPKVMVETACALLVQERGYRGVWTALATHDERTPWSFAAAGQIENIDAASVACFGPAGPPCFAKLEHAQGNLLAINPGRDCHDCPMAGSFGDDTMVILPLRHDHRRFGYFGVRMAQPPHDEERDLILELAGDISFALHTINLEGLHRDTTAELTARGEMLNIVAEGIGLARQSDGKLFFTNPAMEKMFGCAGGELLGLTIGDLLGCNSLEQGRPDVVDAIATQGMWNEDLRPKRKDGTRFWCNCAISSWTHPKHGPVWISLYRDISKRRELEDQYRQSQKMEAVGQLAGGVAHDFNNLLAALTLQIDDLHADVVQRDIRERLEDMLTTTKRASSLTRQLLLFSRRQAVVMAPLDLALVVDGMGRLLGRILGEKIQLVIGPSPELLWVEGDHGMLEQVIMNLALNARDAMPQGGRLELLADTVTLSPLQATQIRNGRAGAFVRLRVADTGVGLSPEVREHLFEPFFTTKEIGQGTGLGLATVQSIVLQHQGFVDAQGRPGGGSTFSVFLPRQPAGKPAEPPKAAATQTAGGGRALVVEDEDGLRDLAARSLVRLGFQVTMARTGEEALHIWKESAFDLLFTDIVMPGPLSGLDLCRRIREEKPHFPVVVTSGYAPDLGKEAQSLGEDILYLPKPYDAQALATVVVRALKRHTEVS